MFSFDNSPDLNTVNARALENVRAMVAWKRKDAGLASHSADALPIRSVGIVGAGVMGAEIAAAHIKHNLPVNIFDNNPAALATIAARTSAELAASGNSGDDRTLAGSLLHPVGELAEVAKCDLIIETILEKLPAKQDLFDRLRQFLAPEAIIASNTSTIPIGKLAEGMPSPERFSGLHFCHPVRERPLVEIIRGPETGDDTIAALIAHAKAIEKLPIVVADGPGFVVNRLLLPYLAEALDLLMSGDAVEAIEKAAVDFGMAKGPFRLMDEIGLDTTLQSGWSLAAAFHDRIPVSPLLVALIKSGRLGQKSGAGFFSYAGPALSAVSYEPDPAAIEIIARWATKSNRLSDEVIVYRLLLPMVLEATRILEEGKVRDPRDIDLAAIFGLGFPDRRGGLLRWADTLGAAAILEILEPLALIRPRLQPTRLLLELASQGGRFYE
jgi:3-hydroxyacyl-CoA dehydrogenase